MLNCVVHYECHFGGLMLRAACTEGYTVTIKQKPKENDMTGRAERWLDMQDGSIDS